MKHTAAILLGLSTLGSACAAEKLIPAGSIIQCTVSEPKISSKTEAIGDPVLCRVSHVELYGRSTFPYGSYLVGRFEDYKDPGRLVGKGWMELKFDRLIVQGDTVIPVSARVIEVPKYPVDKEGRIHGTGHPVRDVVEWSIPVLVADRSIESSAARAPADAEGGEPPDHQGAGRLRYSDAGRGSTAAGAGLPRPGRGAGRAGAAAAATHCRAATQPMHSRRSIHSNPCMRSNR